jgi:hypothetical protein
MMPARQQLLDLQGLWSKGQCHFEDYVRANPREGSGGHGPKKKHIQASAGATILWTRECVTIVLQAQADSIVEEAALFNMEMALNVIPIAGKMALGPHNRTVFSTKGNLHEHEPKGCIVAEWQRNWRFKGRRCMWTWSTISKQRNFSRSTTGGYPSRERIPIEAARPTQPCPYAAMRRC